MYVYMCTYRHIYKHVNSSCDMNISCGRHILNSDDKSCRISRLLFSF